MTNKERIILFRETQDDEIFSDIVESLYSTIISICNYYVKKNNRNNSHYDDMIQHSIMAINKAIYDFDVERNVKFNTYCYSCINRAIDKFLRKQPNFFSTDNKKVYYYRNEINMSDNVEDDLLKAVDLEKIRGCMNSDLTDIERKVIEHLYFNKKNVAETSRMLEVPKFTITKNRDTALNKFRKVIGVDGFVFK